MSALERLRTFWRSFSTSSLPMIHPRDMSMLRANLYSADSLETYWNSSEYFQKNEKFHIDLVPKPFVGDLGGASIFVLLLNPGFDGQEYYDESISAYRSRMVANLKQEDLGDYPFYMLAPEWSWTDGGRWWHKKLRPLIQLVVARRGVSYLEAAKVLAHQVCALELIPYASASFGLSEKIYHEMESPRLARAFAHEVAQDERRLVCVLRQTAKWGIAPAGNTILFSGIEARAAHLSIDHVNRMYPYLH